MSKAPIFIVALGLKGGPGKSTLLQNLGACLGLLGLRILLLDADPPQWGVWDFFERRRAAGKQAGKHGSFRVERASFGATRVKGVPDVLSVEFEQELDAVLVDLPGGVVFGESEQHRAMNQVLLMMDGVLIPFRPTGKDLQKRDIVFSSIEAVARSRGRPLQSFVVMNQVTRGKARQRDLRRVITTFPSGIRVLKAQLRFSVDWSDADVAGLIPSEYNPEGIAAADCDKFVREIRREMLHV